jgi:hypothetical protein
MADTPLRIGLVVDQFPELSETFIAAEARELVALGHRVHVESNAHAPEPNDAAAVGLDVSYRVDDDGARQHATTWLVARHPLAAVRDLVSQRRWRARSARRARWLWRAGSRASAPLTCTRTLPRARRSTRCGCPRFSASPTA